MAGGGHRFDPTILREYDIRGVVGENLTAADALALGRTLGTIVARSGGHSVAIAYDGRLTSPELESALVDGVTASGLIAAQDRSWPDSRNVFRNQGSGCRCRELW